jgi:hypothetical protein
MEGNMDFDYAGFLKYVTAATEPDDHVCLASDIGGRFGRYDIKISGLNSALKAKDFLESLKIQTTRKIEGRDRLVSVKDVHSLRHSFCFLAGIYGIPLLIVQSICGHMTSQMTSLYQRHADLKVKQAAMAKMPVFLSASASNPLPPREELNQIIQAIPDADVEKILSLVKSVGKDKGRHLVVIDKGKGVNG